MAAWGWWSFLNPSSLSITADCPLGAFGLRLHFLLFFRPRAAPAPPMNPNSMPKISEKLSIRSSGERENALRTSSITRITREV